MSVERTFSIIKPDAVAAGQAGEILAMIQKAGFKVVGLRMTRLTDAQAQGFYAVHARAPVLRRPGEVYDGRAHHQHGSGARRRGKKTARSHGRDQPGECGRGDCPQALRGEHRERNCIHGSDAPETAAQELAFFFNTADLL